MRRLAAILAVGFLGLAGFAADPATAAPPFNNFTFPMVATLGTESCVPARGRVTIAPVDTTSGIVENMHVEVFGLPPNTAFALFVIQKPTSKFGLSWYMGDIVTDGTGTGVGDFVGRFSIGTFIVAPGSEPAPAVLKALPFPDASSNPATAPVQLYHLGLWFDSPADANKAGCGSTVTPFNSTHNAGVQILNTSNFPDLRGPLFRVIDR
jgi:hypothetical protein